VVTGGVDLKAYTYGRFGAPQVWCIKVPEARRRAGRWGYEVCGMDSPTGLRGRQPFTEKGKRLRVRASCGVPAY
jgi:hypothetical protein